jgi:hypothetical protein
MATTAQNTPLQQTVGSREQMHNVRQECFDPGILWALAR